MDCKHEQFIFNNDMRQDECAECGLLRSTCEYIEKECKTPLDRIMVESFEIAAKKGARLQEIQMIVWKYMQTPKYHRDGIRMAMDIEKLFEAPMGVSQWKEYGKRLGYWDYFKKNHEN